MIKPLPEQFRLPPSACLYCGHVMEMASNPFGDGGPRPGDLTVCIKCAGYLQYDETLHLQMPVDLEKEPVEVLKRLEMTRYAILTVQAEDN